MKTHAQMIPSFKMNYFFVRVVVEGENIYVWWVERARRVMFHMCAMHVTCILCVTKKASSSTPSFTLSSLQNSKLKKKSYVTQQKSNFFSCEQRLEKRGKRENIYNYAHNKAREREKINLQSAFSKYTTMSCLKCLVWYQYNVSGELLLHTIIIMWMENNFFSLCVSQPWQEGEERNISALINIYKVFFLNQLNSSCLV